MRIEISKIFFLINFAQILKSCSIWLQKSVKPTRDFNKKEIDPLYKFEWQAKRMIKRFRDFDNLLDDSIKNNISNYRTVKNNDARNLPCEDNKVTLRERIAQSGYWKLKLSSQKLTEHIRVYFVTPDKDGTLITKIPTKKGRAIVEIDLDGSYVLSETKIEESNKVKSFDKFTDDIMKITKQ